MSDSGVGPGASVPEGQARALFGDGRETAEEFARLLENEGVLRGVIGPREVPRLWERHLLNCAAIAELVPEGARVADVGSGAGLPGVPLAVARTDVTVILVEPLLRRTAWLELVIKQLQLHNVTVERARAEAAQLARGSDVVTARAVAPLPQLLRWCLPLVRPGGEVLAMKGRRAEEELDAAAPVLKAARVSSVEVEECGRGVLDEPTRVVRIRVAD